MGDDKAESDDHHNDELPGDPVYRPNRPKRPRCGYRLEGPQRPMGPLAPVFMNLYVKWPIFSAKNDEDAESHLLHSNDWMNSQGIG